MTSSAISEADADIHAERGAGLWSQLQMPGPLLRRLMLIVLLAVALAGTVTAWVAGRAAAGKDAVLAVKEDW